MQDPYNIDPNTTKQSEHLSIATEMANSIAENHNPDQQNEMMRHIKQIILERRQLSIEEAKKTLSHLQETFENL